MPQVKGSLVGVLLAITAGIAACSGNDVTVPPTTGTVQVTASTTGPEPDADGYSIQLDGAAPQAIEAGGTVQVEEVAPGDHSIQLSGIAAHCAVSGENPRTVTVAAGEMASVTFEVTCGATSGGLQVTTTTSGATPDGDGYRVTVDGADAGAIGASGTLTVNTLLAGDHVVGLAGVAANCRVDGENPRTITVIAGQSGTVAFAVTCEAPPANAGTIRVTTATTGPDPDPNGYRLAVDGGQGQAIGVSASASLANVAAGSHQVRITDIAKNCTVQGDNPRSVSVTAGGTAEVGFAITCSATTGSIRVTVATSGSPIDPDGYIIKLDGHEPGQPIAASGTATLASVPAGNHKIDLTGIAQNCSVTDGASRNVSVAVGSSTEVSFAVTCSGSTGSLKLTVTTTGERPDADGYSVSIDAGSGQHLPANGELTIQNLSPGAHTLGIAEIADNCAVNGDNPRTVSITAGSITPVEITISCPAPSSGPGSWSTAAPIPTVLADMGAAVIQNTAGQSLLFAIGGSDYDSGQPNKTVQAYNVATDTWSRRADLPAARYGVEAGTIAGKIYVVGGGDVNGQATNTLYQYDPGTDSWTERAPLPVAATDGITAVMNGQLYFFTPAPGERLYRYDPAADSWTRLADPIHSHHAGIAGAIGSTLYLAWGGSPVDYAVDAYDPATNTWTTKLEQPYANRPRELCGVDFTDCSVHSAGGAVLSGQLYVIGGRNEDNGMNLVFAYDPVANTWIRKANTNFTREHDPVAGTVRDRNGQLRIAIVGGVETGELVPVTEIFTP